jgi:hypothetical protein
MMGGNSGLSGNGGIFRGGSGSGAAGGGGFGGEGAPPP